MQSMITFDTLDYKSQLTESGMDSAAAEAITKATAKAFNQMLEAKELATKSDLHQLKSDLLKSNHETVWKVIGFSVAFQSCAIGLFAFLQQYLSSSAN